MTDRFEADIAAQVARKQLLANIDTALVEGNWPENAEWAFTNSDSKETEFFLSDSDLELRFEEFQLQALKEERCFSFSVYRWDWGPVFVEKRHIVVQ